MFQHATAARRARRRHVVEALESRTLLVGYAFNWVGGPGDWADRTHWTSNAPDPNLRPVPGLEDTVSIPASAGTVTASGRSMFTGVIDANLRITGGMGIYGGSLTLNGTLTLAGGGGQNQLSFLRSTTVGGSGTITVTNDGGQIVAQGLNLSLTLGPDLTIRSGSSIATFTGTNITSFAHVIVEGSGISFNGGRFTNRGTIDVNGGTLRLDGPAWANFGTINLNAGRLQPAGTWRQSDLGQVVRNGGSIFAGGNLVGDLTLDEHTASWNSVGGFRLTGGRLTTSNGATFSPAGATFDNYTLASDLSLSAAATTFIRNALTLDGVTLRMNNANVDLITSQTFIRGNGQVLMNGGTFSMPASDVFTVDAGVELRVDGGNGLITGTATTQRAVLHGPVNVARNGNGLGLVVQTTELSGQMNVVSGGSLNLFRTLTVLPGGGIATGPRSGVNLSQLGRIINAATSPRAFSLRGTTTMLVGSSAAPTLLEAAGEDRGPVPDGYRENFAMGVLRVGLGNVVRLVDSADNATGAGPEALYVDSLVVPNAAILDLNGLKLYARAFERTGTGAVVGGTVTLLPDGGPIAWAATTSGRIAEAGQRDDWTFFGRAGQTVSAVLNPSFNPTPSAPAPVAPQLQLARLSLLSPGGAELAAVQNATQGTFDTLPGVVLPADGVYTLRAQASTTDANRTGVYNLTLYDVTAETRPLLLNTVTNGAVETPFTSDRWTFGLSAGQQVQFDLLSATSAGLLFTLEGPEGYVAFTDIPGDSPLVTAPPGRAGNYVLTARGQTDQTGAYRFLVRDESVTTLDLGTTFSGVLPGSGSPKWFKTTLPSPGQLLVTLDDSTAGDRNQLYVRRGAPPTREVFDYRFRTLDADEQIFVPDATAGDWYVLVYAEHVPAPSAYTLKAEYSDLRVTTATPDRYGVGNTMTMTLTGGGFGPGTTVRLVSGNTLVNATAVEVDSFTHATATFDLAGVALGVYDIRAERGTAGFTLPRAFTALANGPGRLEMKLVLPSVFTPTSVASGRIEYANTGNVALPAPLMVVQSADPQGNQFPVLSLDLARTVQDFWSAAPPPGVSHRLMVLGSGAVPGVLNPGERISVPFNYLGEKSSRDTDLDLELELLCVEADGTETAVHGGPLAPPSPLYDSPRADWLVAAHGHDAAQEVIDWGALKQSLRPSTVPAAIWDDVYGRITAPLDSVGDYVRMLIEDAQYLGRLGQRVVDVDELWNFRVQQGLGTVTAFPTLAASVDAAVPAPLSPVTLGRTFPDGVLARNTVGPFGYGWAVPWVARLETVGNGDVVAINSPGGGRRTFVRDSRLSSPTSATATYISGAGDPSTLRRVTAGVYELRDVGGTVTRFRSDGRIDYVEDPNANRTTAGYDGSGRLTSLAHTSGGSIQLAYNGAGRVSGVTDSLGHSVAYAYDAAGEHLLTATADDGTTVAYTYDTSGGLLKRHALLSEQSAGSTQVYTYDALGRVASSFTAGGAQPIQVSYDLGRVTLTDAAGTGQLFFDHRLRLARVTNALGYSTRLGYDGGDHLASVLLPDGSRQSYTWCDCGSLMGATDELGRTSKVTRDPATRKVTSIADPKGNVSRITYDSKGNQLAMIHADGSSESAGNYSASGLPQSFTNRRGQASTYAYDAAGRLTRRTAPDGWVTTYGRDARGRLTSVTQGTRVTSVAYDTAVDGDRPKRVTYPDGRFVEYDYDDLGRWVATRDSSGGVTRYEYDAAGRLSHVRDAAGAALVTYGYDAAGRLARTDNANGTFTTYGYDAAGQVLTEENWRSAGVLNSRFAYTYDARGRRTGATTPEGTWAYTHDAAGQLTAAAFASTSPSIPDQSIRIAYDAAGNRTFATVNGVLHDYASNALNQYTRVDGIDRAYDADGNLLSDGVRQYAYDDLNRLVQITAGADVQQFEYNAFGGRSASIVNGVRTGMLVTPGSAGEVLAEFDAGGNLLARNVFAGTLVGRTGPGGALHFADYDMTGSVVGLTDAAGAYVNRYAYDPYGNVLLNTEAVSNPYEFGGALGVRAGIGGTSHMGFRQYSAADGRFTTVDPLRAAGDVNAYRYAANSPVMNADPTGLFAAALRSVPLWVKSSSLTFPVVGKEMFFELLYGVAVDQWQNVAIGERADHNSIAVSFALNAGFGLPGLNGFANAFQLAMNPEVNQNFVSAACGLAYQREFGTLNKSAAKQMAALAIETGGGAGGRTVHQACLDGFPQSPDADMGIGDRCAYAVSTFPRAHDPNDKVAPAGVGPENFVRIDRPIEYTVDFENLGPGSRDDNGNPYPIVAAGPAQRVAVDDPFSTHFDWASVVFTEFRFGDTVVQVDPGQGAGSFHGSVPVQQGGASIVVQIDADVDLVTGVLSIVLQALDPQTSLPPQPLVGVLPPEDGTGRGLGLFKFSVRAKADAAHGTVVRNVAYVRFDQNEVIATNQVNPLDPSAGTDPAREAMVTLWDGRPLVVGRHVFYNNSALDGNDPSAGVADDAALADTVALLPGQAATAANVTNHSRGLNGVMVDVAALPADEPTAADFLVELSADGATWSPGPAPAVSVRRSVGAYGTDRLTLTLPDGAARNTWVRVTLAAGPRTGLGSPDVFYFGNLVGNAGNDRGNPVVNATDVALVRANLGRTGGATLNRFDFNRDGAINGIDLLLARANQRRMLPLFAAPPPVAGVRGAGGRTPGSRHNRGRKKASHVPSAFDVVRPQHTVAPAHAASHF